MFEPAVNHKWCGHAYFVDVPDPLPGERGIACDKRNGDGCTPEWSECPRIERSKRFCPSCFTEGRIVPLLHDPESASLPHYCPECESHWSDVAFLDVAWEMTVEELNERYAEVVRIPAGLPEHVYDDYSAQAAM